MNAPTAKPFIPVSSPSLTSRERDALVRAFDTTWIGGKGAELDRMESALADLHDVPHALATSSGTTALHLALLGIGVGPGDEVIVPSMTYIATANAVRYCGATPIFVDVDPATWGITWETVRSSLTDRTKAVVAVHLYGVPADVDVFAEKLSQTGIGLVEDVAEAPFASLKSGKLTGTVGDVSTFSFFGNKIVTCGEGGALLTSDDDIAEQVAILRGQGMDPNRRYFFPVVGYNYRLTNMQAAVLNGQLERLDWLLAARADIGNHYRERLSEGTLEFQVPDSGASPVEWLVTGLLPKGVGQATVRKRMEERGIETRPTFIPIHRLPPYASDGQDDLPVTADIGTRGISLPTFPDLPIEQVDYVCDSLMEIVGAEAP